MAQQINAVFKGGGAKGVAYAGAVRVCEELELEFRAVAGSSAGAITALLVACGYRADDLAEMLPSAMRSLDRPLAAAPRIGRPTLLATGSLRSWLNETVERALRRSFDARVDGDSVTFAQIRAITNVDLYVVAMDLGSRQPVVFSPDVTPEAAVVPAVVASSAIPVAFPPVRMAAHGAVRRLIDGGVWANYPSFVFLDEDFRAAHTLEPPLPTTVGFIVDDRPPTRPDPSELTPATDRVQDSDLGASARELGRFGGLITSPLLRLSIIVAPVMAFWVLLQWVRSQASDAFPAFRALPNMFEDLAGLVALLLTILLGLLFCGAAVIAIRLGRALLDGGLGGAIAATGVGPSVPYWAGAAEARQTDGRSHSVVRIRVPDALTTLRFGADVAVLNEAIRAGYEAAGRDLVPVVRGRAHQLSGRPPQLSPGPVSRSRRIISSATGLPKRLRKRYDSWIARSSPGGSHAARRIRWIPRLRVIAVVVGWFLLLLAVGNALVTLVQAEARGEDRRLWLVFVFGPLLLLAVWLYSSARHRKAARPLTWLRRQSDRRLIVGGSLAIALTVAAFALDAATVGDRPFSLVRLVENAQYVDASVVEAEILDDSPAKTRIVVEIGETIDGERCVAKQGDQFQYEVNRLARRGDVESITLFADNCQAWLSRDVHGEVSNRVIGFLVTLALFTFGVNCVLALQWRRRYRADHGVESLPPTSFPPPDGSPMDVGLTSPGHRTWTEEAR